MPTVPYEPDDTRVLNRQTELGSITCLQNSSCFRCSKLWTSLPRDNYGFLSSFTTNTWDSTTSRHIARIRENMKTTINHEKLEKLDIWKHRNSRPHRTIWSKPTLFALIVIKQQLHIYSVLTHGRNFITRQQSVKRKTDRWPTSNEWTHTKTARCTWDIQRLSNEKW